MFYAFFQYRDKQRGRKEKRSLAGGGTEGDLDQIDEPGKKGKKKLVYGVNNTKYYTSNTSKQCVESLKVAGKIEQFEAREKIFNDNRPALMKLIRFFSFILKWQLSQHFINLAGTLLRGLIKSVTDFSDTPNI